MANQVMIIRSADAGLWGSPTFTLRIEGSLLTDITTRVDIVVGPVNFKPILEDTASACLSQLKGKLIIVDDATNPPTYISGIDLSSLTAPA
jgi:hypothetical protein